MSTNELINKLKAQQDALPSIKELKVGTESFEPIFSIASTILKTKSLIDEGTDPIFTELLLPHLATTFGPPLIANAIYPRFKFSQRDLVVYLIGFILSLFVHSNSFLMFFIKEVPYVSRFFSLVKMKNSTEDTFLMFCWVITCDIAGQFISKLTFKKKFKVKTLDLLKMVVVYGGVLALRQYRMPDYYVIVVANIVPLSIKAVEYLKKVPAMKIKHTECIKEEDKKAPIRKAPKRKASLSAKLEKSK
ncbi:uncharacterized protein VICG_00293 [Vittaforma corneae ATCC 50505]|uniref:Uncharacterized protein n=1 Tax=Vittaforma corneae (strain ATCC 50505) TaxID=993615 RepID=L2GNX7_VITCO|nr:uncharacterized protein VICG_00293 [Vittaforma corneae ATCC 50505]ELA42541.1 hypothetical protein VICG_00293 [Vittaforma corneae ATCC 50505]